MCIHFTHTDGTMGIHIQSQNDFQRDFLEVMIDEVQRNRSYRLCSVLVLVMLEWARGNIFQK